MNGKLKKILSGIALLAAFGLGGAALAGARSGTTSTPAPTGSQSQGAGDQADSGNADEAQQTITGPDADRAGQAAIASVGGGKVLTVEKETPEAAGANEKPDPNEKPDAGETNPAQEQAIDSSKAYSVQVQKTDGTKVDVTLDAAFKVLQSEVDNEGQGGANG
ncbi:MAG: hypothetical protein QOH72_5752 [Solirubrobacteraceae bacterium]|nr:hypothetical protein [Solirubrobacteraceae bacterium]